MIKGLSTTKNSCVQGMLTKDHGRRSVVGLWRPEYQAEYEEADRSREGMAHRAQSSNEVNINE